MATGAFKALKGAIGAGKDLQDMTRQSVHFWKNLSKPPSEKLNLRSFQISQFISGKSVIVLVDSIGQAKDLLGFSPFH